jgi:hypothetical protein
MMRDREGFERFANQCASEYAKGQSPYLNVNYVRLLEEARQREIFLPTQGPTPVALSLRPFVIDPEQESLRNKMLECHDAAERARCALTLLLQSTESYLGYLYAVADTGLVLLAGLPDTKAEPGIERWLADWVGAERTRVGPEVDGTQTISTLPPPMPDETARDETRSWAPTSLIHTERDGRRFIASALTTVTATDRRLVAMLAVQITGPHLPTPPLSLCQHLAQLLLEQRDATGIALVDVTED